MASRSEDAMNTPNDPAWYFATLAGELADDAHNHNDADVSDVARAVLSVAGRLAPQTEHIGMVGPVARRGVRSLCSSSGLAARCDAWQVELSESPARDTSAGWVRSNHLPTEHRWPSWTARAVSAGVRSLLVVPMLAGHELVASLSLYGLRAGGFDDDELVERVRIFGMHAGVALRQAGTMTDMRTALNSRHDIGMAQGILMERFGLDPDAAFAVLKRYSSTLNTPLRTIAAHLARTGALPVVDARLDARQP